MPSKRASPAASPTPAPKPYAILLPKLLMKLPLLPLLPLLTKTFGGYC